ESGNLPPSLLLVGLTEHAELDAANPGFIAAGDESDDQIELDLVVELAVGQAGGADTLQPAAHPFLAAPDPLAADFDDTFLVKQVKHVVPHLAVGVKAVGGLEIADTVFLIHRIDPRLKLRQGRVSSRRGAS